MTRIIRQKTGIPAVDMVVGPLVEENRDLQAQTLSGCLRIANVALSDGTQKRVKHRLGRKPQSWWPARPRNHNAFYRIEEISSDETFLILKVTGSSITIDVFVI